MEPEQQLAVAVLRQAIKDYRFPPLASKKQIAQQKGRRRKEIESFVNSELAEFWCDLAGVDIEYFRSIFNSTKNYLEGIGWA